MAEVGGGNERDDLDEVGGEGAEVFSGEEDDWAVRRGPEAAKGKEDRVEPGGQRVGEGSA